MRDCLMSELAHPRLAKNARFRWGMSWSVRNSAREIPRPAGENAGLRNDGYYVTNVPIRWRDARASPAGAGATKITVICLGLTYYLNLDEERSLSMGHELVSAK